MIRPLEDKILIKMKDYQDKTRSGIILSTASKETEQVAEVIEVGHGKKVEFSNIKKGDTIIINKYVGTEVQYEGIDYTVIKVEDVLAIVE